MENSNKNQLDTLRSEHLKEGVKPIVACIGSGLEYRHEIQSLLDSIGVIHDVDYEAEPIKYSELDYKSGGKYSYVISSIDDKSKVTSELYRCTSLVAVGRDKNSEEVNLSLLTHQDPEHFLDSSNIQKFEDDLSKRLEELKERSADNTVDVVIVGGELNQKYEESVNLLSEITQNIFGFVPVVISGPKTEYGFDDVYFDNNNRRLYVVRPYDDDKVLNGSFQTNDVKSGVNNLQKSKN